MVRHVRVGQRAAVVLIVIGTFLAFVLPASAEYTEDPNAVAKTEGDGVTATIGHEADGSVSVHHASESSCEWRVEPFQSTGPVGASLPPGVIHGRYTEDSTVYTISCGAEYLVLQWLAPRDIDDAVRPVAEELIHRVTAVPANVTVRPDSRGITGIPSKFWVEGVGAQPLTDSITAFGLTVTVNVQLVEVEWDFGDGGKAQAQSFSEDTAVLHPYRNTSGAQPYAVTATLLFQPTYTVNGVAGPTLDPIQIPVTRPYVVHQVQAQRVR